MRRAGDEAASPQAAALQGVSRTLLVTLCARALARETFPNLGFTDPTAEALIAALDIDPHAFARTRECVFGVARRSMILDEAVRTFADRHGEIAVLNLGAGLSSAFERLDDGRLAWWDLDLEAPIRLHGDLTAVHPRRTHVVASVDRPGWQRALRLPARPLIVLAEGLMPYLTPPRVRALLTEIAAAFGDRPLTFAFDAFAFAMCGMAKMHPSIGPLARDDPSIEFRWGVSAMDDYRARLPMWRLAELTPILEGLSPGHTLACAGFSALFGVPLYAVARLEHQRV
ncbi:class I SAM-dependent methyltransferase [Segnochrobactrum spirostomi]|uniref:Class I SAM-dependent methyltransferase n=1 Tax=Segnochrobactrum spirostomi TaxID=2608987 RepID=A0A6A7XYJ7_9HYPH|nr:class I SAM-dependent methyltransferase [Segnochrobactrum spirostomi]MQT11366.1 class I SAM-dependent methyltransferase [Segnochrobactrum spirostomi]